MKQQFVRELAKNEKQYNKITKHNENNKNI